MSTENINPASEGLDALKTEDLLALMLKEEQGTLRAISDQLDSISRAVDSAVVSLKAGGKVYYAGAGTSGRLGVLDAAEVLPTFGSNSFKAVIAGGPEAVSRAVEGAEDDEKGGIDSAKALGPNDMAIGISASGRTSFVMGFLKGAHKRGARCWLVTCGETPDIPLEGVISINTGPEVIAGSTRLKAGTATKIALNMLSTATMVRLGGAYNGLMVDVIPSNRKLIIRAEGIVMRITGCSQKEAADYLRQAGMSPKVASLMILKSIEKDEALNLLSKYDGSLRDALKG